MQLLQTSASRSPTLKYRLTEPIWLQSVYWSAQESTWFRKVVRVNANAKEHVLMKQQLAFGQLLQRANMAIQRNRYAHRCFFFVRLLGKKVIYKSIL